MASPGVSAAMSEQKRGPRAAFGAETDAAGKGGDLNREPVEEQVVCTCRYGGVLFHYEHGFHQPSRMDRQEMRLVFERGEVRIFDWVPTHGELRGLVDDDGLGVLTAILPGSVVHTIEQYEGDRRRVRGRSLHHGASEPSLASRCRIIRISL